MPDDVQDRPCRKCQRPLLFVRQEDSDKLIPLDAATAVYLVYRTGDGQRRAVNLKQILQEAQGDILVRYTKDSQPQALQAIGAYVSHFATCSHAAAFSKQGRPPQQGRTDTRR